MQLQRFIDSLKADLSAVAELGDETTAQAERALERDDELSGGVRRGLVAQFRDRGKVGLERIDESL